jgi:excisionase family DNA binding protein
VATTPSQIDLSTLPEFLTPEEVARVYRTGRTATYDAIRRGEIEHVKIGRVIRIPRRVLLEAAGRSGGPRV